MSITAETWGWTPVNRLKVQLQTSDCKQSGSVREQTPRQQTSVEIENKTQAGGISDDIKSDSNGLL